MKHFFQTKFVDIRLNVFVVFVFYFAATVFFKVACFAQQTPSGNAIALEYHLNQAKEEMKPLNLSQPSTLSSSARIYLQHYGIYFEDIPQYLGTFQSGADVLSAHIFLPLEATATVFVLHGYCDHMGILKHLIRLLIQQRLAVAIYDLPGHGLSNGASCLIHDFSEYVDIFEDFIGLCQPYLPQPYHFVGHSTGCAIAFDYMHRISSERFDKVIFIAPLVRSAYWKISKAHLYLAKPFVETIPRVFFDSSSDPEFNQFIQNDPLQCQEIPLKWVQALFDWNERVEAYRSISQPVLILQGRRDTVVDWEFNVPFLQKKNSAITVKWFEDGKHHLLNERQVIRSEVRKAISDYLQSTENESNVPESMQHGATP